MQATIIATNRQWRDRAQPHRAIAEGLKRLGHSITIITPESKLDSSAMVFLWNGIHGRWGNHVIVARKAGTMAFVMERGFFDRMNYTQINHTGFNHLASWASDTTQPATSDNAHRLARVWGAVEPITTRRDGYILVLGQVAGDSQLRDCALQHSDTLVEAVQNTTPHDVEIRFRPHPLVEPQLPPNSRAMIMGSTLAEAVAGARFIVTINSNAGNEALAMGCPVLCFGPALYGMAGVALETTLLDLHAKIKAMLSGYRPCQANVTNYLRNLAGRQWNNEELAAGDVLAELIEAANV